MGKINKLLFVLAIFAITACTHRQTGVVYGLNRGIGLTATGITSYQENGFWPDRTHFGSNLLFGETTTTINEDIEQWWQLYFPLKAKEVIKSTPFHLDLFLGHSLFRFGEPVFNVDVSVNLVSMSIFYFRKVSTIITVPDLKFEQNVGASFKTDICLFENFIFTYEGILDQNQKTYLNLGIKYTW